MIEKPPGRQSWFPNHDSVASGPRSIPAKTSSAIVNLVFTASADMPPTSAKKRARAPLSPATGAVDKKVRKDSGKKHDATERENVQTPCINKLEASDILYYADGSGHGGPPRYAPSVPLLRCLCRSVSRACLVHGPCLGRASVRCAVRPSSVRYPSVTPSVVRSICARPVLRGAMHAGLGSRRSGGARASLTFSSSCRARTARMASRSNSRWCARARSYVACAIVSHLCMCLAD